VEKISAEIKALNANDAKRSVLTKHKRNVHWFEDGNVAKDNKVQVVLVQQNQDIPQEKSKRGKVKGDEYILDKTDT
jgi:hypothetical protein